MIHPTRIPECQVGMEFQGLSVPNPLLYRQRTEFHEKEIACLITKEDLEKLDLSEIKDAVIIPGRSFVHQLDAETLLNLTTANGGYLQIWTYPLFC